MNLETYFELDKMHRGAVAVLKTASKLVAREPTEENIAVLRLALALEAQTELHLKLETYRPEEEETVQ